MIIFDIEEGLLLADGYHRLAAAKQRGATTIKADVRRGTLREAIDFAIDRAVEERGVTREQALDAILRHSDTTPNKTKPPLRRHD